MKTIIHVNQAIIKANLKNGTSNPPLICRTYKGSKNAQTLEILDKDGTIVARILHRPHNPLSCGARVWIETECEVRLS